MGNELTALSMSRLAGRTLRQCIYSSLRISTTKSYAPSPRVGHQQFLVHAPSRTYRGLKTNESPKEIHHNDYLNRVEHLDDNHGLENLYPRIGDARGINGSALRPLSPVEFKQRYLSRLAKDGQNLRDDKIWVLGRVSAVRSSGSKLLFINLTLDGTLQQDADHIQVVCSYSEIKGEDDAILEDFRELRHTIRKGDWLSAAGYPLLSKTGKASVRAQEMPCAVSPSLHQVPQDIQDAEKLTRNPHIKHFIDASRRDVLVLRHWILHTMRQYLTSAGFIEVETPMLEVSAGGATARPFETVANELLDTQLKLRIAPELSLKRLVIAGQEKVFELGRVFRNEGVDFTHNPEFSICEFYETGISLDGLIERTEELFQALDVKSRALEDSLPSLKAAGEDRSSFEGPFKRLSFIPTIERSIGRKLPDLSSSTATQDVTNVFNELNIPLPSTPALPNLVEALGELYIEPLCTAPTFVTYHPECLSPLAKSFVDSSTGQRVAARAELFIGGREYVNCYEEENSPFEQRRKLEMQQRLRVENGVDGESTNPEVDESYLAALEWGMPPTGGWGCGVDRVVMLFAGQKRIADVLPFGTLRNMVGIAGNRGGGTVKYTSPWSVYTEKQG